MTDGPRPLPRRVAARVVLTAAAAFVAVAAIGHAVRAALDAPAAVTPDPVLLGIGALFWTAGIAAQGPRWAAMLPEPRPGAARAALALCGTNALTVTVPGPSGEALLAAWAQRTLGIPWATAAAAQLTARLLGVAVLAAALWLGVATRPGLAGWAHGAGLAAAVGLTALAVFLTGRGRAAAALHALYRRAPARLRTAAVDAAVGALTDALAPTTRPALVRATLWSMASTLGMGAGGYCSALAVDLAPATGTYLWMHIAASLAGVLAFVMPAGIGAVDGVWVALFVASGRSAAEGVTAAVAWRQAQALSLLLNAGPLLWVGRRAAT